LEGAPHASSQRFHRTLLTLRQREITLRLAGMRGGESRISWANGGPDDRSVRVAWRLGDEAPLTLTPNLGDTEYVAPEPGVPLGSPLYSGPGGLDETSAEGRFPPWSVI
jgi:hypothetical protein